MIPSQGRTVQYTLSEQDADQINFRRDDMDAPNMGNRVSAGDTYPLVITRVWSQVEGGAINGQVLLDGNDIHWVLSVTQGDGVRQYREFPRV